MGLRQCGEALENLMVNLVIGLLHTSSIQLLHPKKMIVSSFSIISIPRRFIQDYDICYSDVLYIVGLIMSLFLQMRE
uniref:Uncharacterized protein n=1 Tax=Aegilops tauschii subsp. strangulata TaxID=200361 RepID=A0A453DXJ2_AEGTS